MKKFAFVWLAVAIVAVGLLRLPTTASADGNETLGPPSIAIASGSGVAAAGVGLALAQPGVIELTVPGGTVVNQVLLYWEGQATSEAALDDTIVINGIDVTGLRIGGPDFFFFSSGGVGIGSATYRADITGLGLVSAGLNILTVGGLSFDFVSNGAGVMAIYSDGTDGGIQLVDGNDLAFVDFPAPRDTTVAQTFTFASDIVARTATVDMFFSSAAGLASTGGAFRPSVIDVFVDGVLTNEIHNAIISADGEEWDTLTVAVTIPAGATSVTIHPQSEDGLPTGANPASFAWNAASFTLPDAPPSLGAALFLLIDEDSIDNGGTTIQQLSFNAPFCGGGDPAVCVNDDIADPGVRTVLFERGNDITPYAGLELPTGQVSDEGLFWFTNADPQVSLQNGASFTVQELVNATGAAADENNLDKIDGLAPLGAADINALVGKTVCGLVYDSDISINFDSETGDTQGSAKGATKGLTAFEVVSTSPHPAGGSYLPLITINLLPAADVQEVCSTAVPIG